ncbi:hypothetical protein AYI70_g2785 [Smittium culicis]|uniref:Uncharacterized protein n=1 Tax=Smittium culicis TaxID=133412 RepID=A0A1R1Y724_9FUNG|nr:hypothetical protein AYI70_g2785 [Smittium culicis]
MESAAGTDAYQFRGVSDDLIYATSQGDDRTISIYKFRQHNSPFLCSEIWRHYIGEASGHHGASWKNFLLTNTRPQVAYIPSILNPENSPGLLTAQTEW